MRDISTKFTGDSYAATEFNSSQVELENIVTSAGLTLDPAGGPDANQNQLGQAAAAYACGGSVFGTAGTVNDILLSHTSLLKNPAQYIDKMRVTFEAAGTNTGAVTVNVGGIGPKNVLNPGASPLVAGQIVSGAYTTFIYDTSLESGAGAFVLMPYITAAPTSTVRVVHYATFASPNSGTITSGSWQVRTINRIDANDIGAEVTLASNQLHLPNGRYDFWITIHGYIIDYTAIMIYNETLATRLWPANAVRGLVYFSAGSDHQANLSGSFTLSSAANLTIQTYSTTTRTNNGQGEAMVISGRIPETADGQPAENIYLDWMLVRRNTL